MTVPDAPLADQLRRKQISGLLILAVLVLIFTVWRTIAHNGWHAILPHNW